jgi:methylenetetrahydrofolate--tRNA-(uracil-5-)-methyltransferase
MQNGDVTVIGGGLAGSEAAWQLAAAGFTVNLFEMRPEKPTGAHVTGNLAELVCSNSLGSNLLDRAPGVLKQEMRILGSLLLELAERTSLPAGGALAVDRDNFASLVTQTLSQNLRIRIIREEVTSIPDIPTIIASGPLTSSSLTTAITEWAGQEHLYFYDAISPIVALESINFEIAYRASRYGQGDSEHGDYINCPMSKDQYNLFVNELNNAQRIELKSFEMDVETGVKAGLHEYFEGCLPVEVMARRGQEALAFGPLRPVGLIDPRTGKRPYAVVQLRQDNIAGSLYNLVGFQTNLTFSEQKRVFRMIPGLEQAIFERYGQMHRNTFIYSPALLEPTLQSKRNPQIFFAGQITGIEGYAGNIASGLLAGLNLSRFLKGQDPLCLPRTTMLGSLCHYITHSSEKDFQPMKANFGLLPPLPQIEENQRSRKHGRKEKGRLYSERSLADLRDYLDRLIE